ncbi:MAG: thioredoxin-like negative regulator of GroEL [Myxococcota bacterium]|jgi:thioredoxin-like negative regulator of GroEL
MGDITLTMIVKDEAERLPGALASADGAVDRIVIVDTGSSDDTVAIARAAGAVVIEHAFTDFADARNAALSAVGGGWMLVLDADERLAPGAAAAIRAASVSGSIDFGLMPCHSAASSDATIEGVLSGQHRLSEPVLVARLFRWTEDFCWEGAAHETPQSWMLRHRSGDIDAPIVHYGGTPVQSKHRRSLRLLQQRVEADPRDVSGQAYLARELIWVGDTVAARQALDAAWAVVQADESQRGEMVTLGTMRAWDQLQQEDDQGAMETLSTIAGWGAVHPNMFLLQGMALENLSGRAPEPQRATLLRQAVSVLSMCTDFAGGRFTEEVIAGATGWAADIRRGACLLALGEPEEARPLWQRAFSERPELEAVRLGLAESLLESDPAQALDVLAPIRAEAGIDGWLLAAAAHEARAELREMAEALMAAVQHVRGGFRARHRRAMLDELVSLLGVLQGDPRPGRGAVGTLAGLMSGYPPSAGTVHPLPAGSPDARRIGHVLRYLSRNGEEALLAALGEPQSEQLFPGIGGVLAEVG